MEPPCRHGGSINAISPSQGPPGRIYYPPWWWNLPGRGNASDIMPGPLLRPGPVSTRPVAGGRLVGFPESVWQAPLVPAALALTAGIVADRYFAIPLSFSLSAAGAS